MARPQKIGLDYFPLDNNISDDDKMFYLESEHGIIGFGVYIKLLTRIYDNGYYIEWDKFRQNVLSRKINVDINVLLSVVNTCIECGLFNQMILEKYNILTSKAIQKRYFEATSRRRNVNLIEEYSLISIDEYNNIELEGVNVDINYNLTEVNDDFSTQRKGQKRKEKKRTEKDRTEQDRKEQLNRNSTDVEVIEFEKEKTPYKKIVDKYNDILGNIIPSVRSLSKKRKNKIKVRWNEELDSLDKWEELFHAVEEQDFCLGSNKSGWTVTFDWLITNSNNYVKILERQYANSNGTKTKDQEKRRMERMYGDFLNE